VPLATLAALKERLGIPAGDTSEDDGLSRALDAASELVLRLTGYSETPGPFSEFFAEVRPNVPFALRRRPVSAIVAATTADGVSLDVAVLAPEAALVVAQPILPMAAPWARGQRLRFVTISYQVTPLTVVPPALQEAAIVEAAYLYRRGQGAWTDGSDLVGVGGVSEKFAPALAPGLQALLAPYIHRRGRTV
jgi:hypothetical protein